MKKTITLISAALFANIANAQLITVTGNMGIARTGHESQLLSNGKVLAFGGNNGNVSSYAILGSSELYNPVSGTWTPSGNMKKARDYPASVFMNDGNVLCVGGDNGNNNYASCEIYNVASGTWAYTDSMATGRSEARTIVLNNSKVLAVGGRYETSCELFDQGTKKWSVTGSLTINRTGGFAATKLPSGDVLVVGGQSDTAEIYSAANGTWSKVTNAMVEARDYCTAILMSNGKVLVAGGNFTLTSEIFDPAANSFTKTSGDLINYVSACEMINLTNGRVLIFGKGDPFTPSNQQSLQVYDPGSSTWYSAGIVGPSIIGAADYTVHKLQTGKILYTAGIWTTGNGANKNCYLINESAIAAGVQEFFSEKQLTCYPNPNHGKLVIDFSGFSGTAEIAVSDITGRKVYAEKINIHSGIFSQELNLEDKTKGMYILQVISGQAVLSKNIIIK